MQNLPRRFTLSKSFLLFSALVWYSMTIHLKNRLLENLLLSHASIIDALYFGGIIGSSLIGTVLVRKIRRDHFLFAWIIWGVVASLLPTLICTASWEWVASAFTFLGITFGLGMPTCLSFFIDGITIERRGVIGGLTLLVTSVVSVPLSLLVQVTDLTSFSATLVGWRLFSLLMFYTLYPHGVSLRESSREEPEHTTFASTIRVRTFTLYFISWLIFSLIDSFEGVIIGEHFDPSLVMASDVVVAVTSALFVCFGGILADRIGRKRIVSFGFVALGLAYAIVGFAGFNDFWPLYSVIDGAAGGVFMITFVLLIWGDLSPQQSTEKYYAIGNIPFFASRIIRAPAMSYVGFVEPFSAFSVAAFFLFVAVLPIMFASETLPEKIMEKRKLKEYLEKAKKAKEKHE